MLQELAPCITSRSLFLSLSHRMLVGTRPEESNFTNAGAWFLPYMCTECAADKYTIAPGCATCSTQCITCHMVHAMYAMPCASSTLCQSMRGKLGMKRAQLSAF